MVSGVDQLAQQRAAAVAPQRGELLERPVGLGVLANAELAQRFRVVAVPGCAGRGAQVAASSARSCQLASQWCMPSGSTGRRAAR